MKISPPAADILIPIRSLGRISERQALATSGWWVTARTSALIIRLTISGIGLEIVNRVLVVRPINDGRRRRGRRRRWRLQALGESDRAAERRRLRTRRRRPEKRLSERGERRWWTLWARGGLTTPRRSAEAVRHIYVHIPFCARICPYCAFYKERADPAQATRFCEAILAELQQRVTLRLRSAERNSRSGRSSHPRSRGLRASPETIFFGGGTPTALTTEQLDLLAQRLPHATGFVGAARNGPSKRIPAVFRKARRSSCASAA